ncbi:MAG: trigger factor [Ignavibacteria bacterium]|nr:trigger factor [Ignavibacteria bacterium]
MEVNIIDKGRSKKEVHLTLNKEELDVYFEKAYKVYAKNFKVDGFRKGKAPVNMVKRQYGEYIRELAITDFVPQEAFNDYVDENRIYIVGTSKLLDVEKKDDNLVTIKIEYEHLPEPETAIYKNIEVTKENIIIDDSDVEEQFKKVILQHSTRALDAQALDNEYIVTVDIQALDNSGTIIIGKNKKDVEIYLGDDKLEKNIYEALKNIKEGEEKVLDLTVSKDKDSNSGKERENQLFRITCKKVEKVIYPELTEEFFKKLTNRDDIKTQEDYKKFLKQKIQEYYDDKSQIDLENSIIQEIVKLNDIEIPDVYVNSILEKKYEEYLNHINKHHKEKGESPKSKEEYIREIRPDTIFNLKWYLISEKIIKQENLTVNDEDYLKLAERELKRLPFDIEVDKFAEMLKKENKYKNRALDNKLMGFLIENANVKVVEKTLKDFEENKIIT